MDPNLKLVLVELNRRFDDQDKKWELRFSNIERVQSAREQAVDLRFTKLESTAAALESSRAALADADVAGRLANLEANCVNHAASVKVHLTALESVRVDDMFAETADRVVTLKVAATDLGTWRPVVEALVDDLKLEV